MPCPPASGVQNQLTDARLPIYLFLSNTFSNAMSASAVCSDLLYARSSASAILCAMKGCLVDAQARRFPPREAANQMTHLQRSSGSSVLSPQFSDIPEPSRLTCRGISLHVSLPESRSSPQFGLGSNLPGEVEDVVVPLDTVWSRLPSDQHW